MNASARIQKLEKMRGKGRPGFQVWFLDETGYFQHRNDATRLSRAQYEQRTAGDTDILLLVKYQSTQEAHDGTVN